MARETLYLRFGAGEQVSWLLDDDPTQVWEGTLAQAAPNAAGRQVVVVVPGVDVVLSQVAVPTRNRGRMAAAVPFLLEEQLAADVEESHFALGERDAAGTLAVAIVDRARMDEWLTRLREAGVQPDRMIPDPLLLPYETGEWSLLFEADGVLVRNAPQGGLGIDAANAGFMLQRALAESEVKPERLRVWLAEGVPAAVLPDDLGIGISHETLRVPPLLFMAAQAHDPHVIDLLQGPYSRRERLGRLWRPWRPVAALLAVWVVLQFGMEIVHYRQLSDEQARLREDVAKIYLQTFPDAKRVVPGHERDQMEQRLKVLRGGGGDAGEFIGLLGAVSAPAALGSVSIDHLSYKAGEIDLDLSIADLQRLDQLKERLADATHMNVEIQSATTRDNGVDARLQIKGGRT
jgi:general secretion pathway protein L